MCTLFKNLPEVDFFACDEVAFFVCDGGAETGSGFGGWSDLCWRYSKY